ncbi:acyl-CoA thioesterase II [Frigoribacterium sp. CFBP9039]|uniref:acyl-CoA thioesterase n=1 Tax=Frigoribacterium TaxID=96492 RepID=UPI0017801AF3|nr:MULTISPECIES: acyl-CoA thioesterase II [Frigoribacterium]MBD8703170.1 acyl-CoA thioesterase II [Frigoribacterium sp. CFBP 13712]MCJ0700491.1 acyl-CoA thioesterase II [Frigoribacterium faeni]MDY0890608.1 acyl-CoA thioesterase II [Frigoribacterium sp. CFBP9030]MDY0944574.1 acyl-CoA thioesterase II [Frigoribacterium sp. CFBP9039]
MTDDPLQSLLATLDLAPAGNVGGQDVFTGTSQWEPLGRVFGGQVMAQSLVAAQRTIGGERAVHSLHAYFLRPGDLSIPITFTVDRIHDGRSFATRRTQASQDGVPILSMIASFQTLDDGLDHQVEMPTDLPGPDDVPSDSELLSAVDHPVARAWAARPFDMRHVPSPVYFTIDGARVAHQAVWMKATSPLPDDLDLHRAALLYASDYTLLETIYRRHGVPMITPGLKAASLDHAMWWHRPGRADEWMLYVQESPNATGGRGLALGRIYDGSGRLLASVAQEGMIRVPRA